MKRYKKEASVHGHCRKLRKTPANVVSRGGTLVGESFGFGAAMYSLSKLESTGSTPVLAIPQEILFEIFAKASDWDVLSSLLWVSKAVREFLLQQVKVIEITSLDLFKKNPGLLCQFSLSSLHLIRMNLSGQLLDISGVQTREVQFHQCKGLHNFTFGKHSRVKSVRFTQCGVVENLAWLPPQLKHLDIRTTTLYYLKRTSFERLGHLKTLRIYQPQITFTDFDKLLALRSLQVLEILGPNALYCRQHLETLFANPSIQKVTAENFDSICFNHVANLCSQASCMKHLCFVNPIWINGADSFATDTTGANLLSLQEWLEAKLAKPFQLVTIPRQDLREDKSAGLASYTTWVQDYDLDLPALRKRH